MKKLDNILEDSIEGYYQEETYSKGLSREDTIEKQVRMTIYFYSNNEWDKFEYSLKSLIAILPKMIREKITIPTHDVSSDGREKHFELFLRIQEIIETDTNMIFKKKFIKTYE